MRIIWVFLICMIAISQGKSKEKSLNQGSSQKNHHVKDQQILQANTAFATLSSEQSNQQVSSQPETASNTSDNTQADTEGQTTSVEQDKSQTSQKQTLSTDNVHQFDVDELEAYQIRFFIMSILAVVSVISCCLGVQYILNFSKSCKIASSEIRWIKEMEAKEAATAAAAEGVTGRGSIGIQQQTNTNNIQQAGAEQL